MFQFGGADACCVSVWQSVLERVHRGFEVGLVLLVAGGVLGRGKRSTSEDHRREREDPEREWQPANERRGFGTARATHDKRQGSG